MASREYFKAHVRAEEAARAAKRGIWSGTFQMPDEWRQERRGQRGSNTSASANDSRNGCPIKGNISRSGQKIYHQSGDRDYGSTWIDTRKGERWFCTVREAQGNGWKHAGIGSRRSNNMRALIGTVGMIVLVYTALPALAEDYVVRDAQGRRAETIERSHGGDLVRRDAEGRRIGTVEDDVGKQVLRDREGRRVGTVEQGSGGDWIIRDSQGRRRYTIEQGVGDQQIIRDQQGRRIGTVEER